jgi:hypothetical protein
MLWLMMRFHSQIYHGVAGLSSNARSIGESFTGRGS